MFTCIFYFSPYPLHPLPLDPALGPPPDDLGPLKTIQPIYYMLVLEY